MQQFQPLTDDQEQDIEKPNKNHQLTSSTTQQIYENQDNIQKNSHFQTQVETHDQNKNQKQQSDNLYLENENENQQTLDVEFNDDIIDDINQLEYDENDITYKRNFGNNIVFKFDPVTKEPKYTLGPHWPLFVVALAFLTFIGIKITLKSYESQPFYIFLLTFVINSAEIYNYISVATKNPGIKSSYYPFKNREKIGKIRQYCKRCQIVKERKTFHCNDCDICIEEFDHHCPWTGKCIGKGNISEFYQFLCNTMLYMLFNIIILIFNNDIPKKHNYA
ncbi:hypothetical protein PPERSA_02394 [Pseudocohnilembus persalinus]|uniref:Palmitoyltransferase n=1 Tax=Pseudocohnilembus persalinus TaxID=266149 RepID=A0A0V0QBG8_PSEPJ|nr:hypothetical protein PPERSA_02394 [Pseudocohnilembus persalinus]|eukprot:KRW99536.1 hypothetical protein PPERSA_02394 [Pseudocohnilembus persalinus]